MVCAGAARQKGGGGTYLVTVADVAVMGLGRASGHWKAWKLHRSPVGQQGASCSIRKVSVTPSSIMNQKMKRL